MGFMKSLISVCKNLDQEVHELEIEAKVAVSSSKGQYASNAADCLKAEADSLCRSIKETAAVVTENKSQLNTFMEEMDARFKDVLNEQIEIEEYMSQYGYKPKIDKDTIMNDYTLVKSYEPIVASDFSCGVENGTTADVKLEEALVEVNQTDSYDQRKMSSDSPDFFEIGLSNMTMEAFCGKSKSKIMNPSSEEPYNLQNGKNESYTSSPALKISTKYSDISVKTSGVQSHPIPSVKAMDCSTEASFAVSPVMRLSTKFINVADIGSPNTTSVQSLSEYCGDQDTSDAQLSADFNEIQSSSASPCLPSYKRVARHVLGNIRPNIGSPIPPELQTKDVKRLVKTVEVFKMTPNMEESVIEEVTPEVPGLIYLKQTEDTPETPELTCMQEMDNDRTPEPPVLRSRAFMSLN